MGESPDIPGAPKPGEVLAGKYRVEQVIGLGGMGAVVAARHASLGSRVAIKVLLPEAAKVPEAVARFLREARAAATIESEHVCKVLDVGELDDGRPFMVMEFLSGQDLGAVLEQHGRRGQDEAITYVLQVCEAIAQAHVHGIVHRDLKPSNLFLIRKADGSPCVKVLDFGISKMSRETDAAVTATSFAFGTPLYMSPEQIRSLKTVDSRTDIWAVGVILHQLLTANLPFEGPTLTALCAAIASDPPSPLRHHLPSAPAALEAVLDRCLEKSANKRFQTVGDLAEALRPFAPPASAWLVDRVRAITAGLVPPPPLPEPSGRVNDPRAADTRSAFGRTGTTSTTPRRVLFAIGGVSIAATIAGLIFLAWPRSAPTAPAAAAPPSASEAPRAAPPPSAASTTIPTASATPPPASPASARRPTPRRGDAIDPLKDRR
jgi:serine/threonine-protein kinase